ncbi:helix-turn-helix domain-containing protein [Streptomyces sp. NPDC006703]|uniref:helix-turn-helix domain-containing protein n=1 Tax=Streptomyces sp. NPDC006703 TaxID=3364759 RepID=UPI0036A6E905
MSSSVDPLWRSVQACALVADQDAGGLIRLGREVRGWRQPDLGRRIGCSASTISRLEQRGGRADLALVQAAAKAVGVPTPLLAASLGLSALSATTVVTVVPHHQEDPVRRRTLLAAAGLAGPASLLTGLDTALASVPAPTGSTVPLDARLAQARGYFDAGQHPALLKALPGLLADAHHAARTRREIELARLSATYSLAAQVLVKVGRYDQGRLTADRAAVYAEWSGSPLVAAAAARELSIVLRHQGQAAAAERHILDAVSQVEATGLRTDAQASAYTQMLCTQSYTAAKAGDRDQALTMIREATRAARTLSQQAPTGRLFPVTPAAVDLYAVGVQWALGDAGAALEAGRDLRAEQFHTPERKARMHTDMARAWWMHGKPEQTAAELLAALRVSPAEVRERPTMRQVVGELGQRHRRTVGVRELVAAVDMPT